MKKIRLDCDGSSGECGQTGMDGNANPDGQVTVSPSLMVNSSRWHFSWFVMQFNFL